MAVILVIVRVLETIMKKLHKKLEEKKLKGRIETVESLVLL